MTAAARNPWLLAGGGMSLAAAAAHCAVIVGGPGWYRAFGAGEAMARMAAEGRSLPALVTLAIVAALVLAGVLALSGAGLVARVALLWTGLVAVTLVYLGRGLFLFVPPAMWRPDLSPMFKLWSSAIVLVIGLIHLVGLRRGWTQRKGVS